MFGRRFYHESLRKVVVAFGTIFNNIIIHRTDADGSVLQRLKVPLSYSPKEKFLVRLEQQPNLDQIEKWCFIIVWVLKYQYRYDHLVNYNE